MPGSTCSMSGKAWRPATTSAASCPSCAPTPAKRSTRAPTWRCLSARGCGRRANILAISWPGGICCRRNTGRGSRPRPRSIETLLGGNELADLFARYHRRHVDLGNFGFVPEVEFDHDAVRIVQKDLL